MNGSNRAGRRGALSRALAVMGLAGLSALAFAPACGGASATSVCDAVCDCRGCSESEYEDCIDGYEDAEKAADDAGCGSEFSDYASCIEDEIACRSDELDLDGCEAEAEALSDCGGGGVGPVGGCEQLLAELEACEPGEQYQGDECEQDDTPEREACYACVLAQSTDLCDDTALIEAVQDCSPECDG